MWCPIQPNALFTTAALDYRSYGGELEATARVAPGLDLFGGIGHTHAELGDVPADSPTGASSGNEVPNVAAFFGNIGAQYRLPGEAFGVGGNFLVRGTHQYIGSRTADVANTFDLDACSIVNAKLGWESARSSPTVRVGRRRIIGLGATTRIQCRATSHSSKAVGRYGLSYTRRLRHCLSGLARQPRHVCHRSRHANVPPGALQWPAASRGRIARRLEALPASDTSKRSHPSDLGCAGVLPGSTS